MRLIAVLTLACCISLGACSNKKASDSTNMAKPKDFMDKVSYMIGYDMGKNMKTDSLKPNSDYFTLGLNMGLKGDSSMFSAKETNDLRDEFQKMMMKKQEAKGKKEAEEMKKKGEKNKVDGEAFLASNKTKPDVITTASGLQYTIVKAGTGKVPKADDRVKVHIKASYLDGKEFDNTYNRQPVELEVGKQVPGWKEAMTSMKTGSIWKIWLPYNLGWGEAGAPPTIPPASVLIFEIELLSIEGKGAAKPPTAQPQEMAPVQQR